MRDNPEIDLRQFTNWARADRHTTGDPAKDRILEEIYARVTSFKGNTALVVAWFAGGETLFDAYAEAEWKEAAEAIKAMAMEDIERINSEFE